MWAISIVVQTAAHHHNIFKVLILYSSTYLLAYKKCCVNGGGFCREQEQKSEMKYIEMYFLVSYEWDKKLFKSISRASTNWKSSLKQLTRPKSINLFSMHCTTHTLHIIPIDYHISFVYDDVFHSCSEFGLIAIVYEGAIFLEVWLQLMLSCVLPFFAMCKIFFTGDSMNGLKLALMVSGSYTCKMLLLIFFLQ